jgi:hypothetical protein
MDETKEDTRPYAERMAEWRASTVPMTAETLETLRQELIFLGSSLDNVEKILAHASMPMETALSVHKRLEEIGLHRDRTLRPIREAMKALPEQPPFRYEIDPAFFREPVPSPVDWPNDTSS